MATLSLAMIVRDEEETLGRVLSGAATFCDEMVIVDTGSTDATKSIAEAAGARVFDFTWIDDFAAARNYSFDQCTSDWILWLDADDVVRPDVQQAMRAVKDSVLSDEIDGVFTPYRYHFLPGTDTCTMWFYRERLLRRAAGLRWDGAIHEVIALYQYPNIRRDDLAIEHRPAPSQTARKGDRNLRIMRSVIDRGERTPRNLFYYANELRDNGHHDDALAVYREYLDNPGPDWEIYSARLHMAQCARQLGRTEEAYEHLFGAMRRDASRAEAYLRMAEIYYASQDWAAAIPLLRAAIGASRPQFGFVWEPDYGYLPWDYLSVSLSNLHRYGEAIEATQRSLELGNPERDRLKANLRWMADQL